MTIQIDAARPGRTNGGRPQARGLARWMAAVGRTSRPRQWPKNLLVFAAPLAGASLGRDDGLGYALVAAAAAAVAAGVVSDVPLLTAAVVAYLGLSFLYSALLKHLPVIELLFVASGFLLRALGGAAATHVRPSVWFLVVCSLGALGVATAKRYTELSVLGPEAVRHRPAMCWYRPETLRLGQYAIGVATVITYLLWAAGENAAASSWHEASAVPLAAALVRFGALTARRAGQPVEDMITRDGPMLACELCWLALFVAGL